MAQPLVAKDSLIITELGLSRPKSVGLTLGLAYVSQRQWVKQRVRPKGVDPEFCMMNIVMLLLLSVVYSLFNTEMNGL